MLTRGAVEAYALSVRTHNATRHAIYGENPTGELVHELVDGIDTLHDMAKTVDAQVYTIDGYYSMEAFDWQGVHFYACDGKVR